MIDIEFAAEQHQIWRELFEIQLSKVSNYACQDYLEGLDRLKLSADIPALENLNKEITPRTGWSVVRTDIRYSDGFHWYSHFAKRKFMVTNYLRSYDNLHFDPEPDMFHDMFGHLPYLTLTRHAELQEMFAPAYFKADSIHKEYIQRLAWYINEAGLIRENGKIKAFGGAILSSAKEIDNVMSDNVCIVPFSVKEVIQQPKPGPVYTWEDAPRSTGFNEVLFVFESLDALKQELAEYFDTL